LIMFLFRFSFVSSISSFSNRNCGWQLSIQLL